jgi:hypothetical protein
MRDGVKRSGSVPLDGTDGPPGRLSFMTLSKNGEEVLEVSRTTGHHMTRDICRPKMALRWLKGLGPLVSQEHSGPCADPTSHNLAEGLMGLDKRA